MVTKATRFQSRRTSTAGKVFTDAELLEGELGLNMADRKLYSKDASGNVFLVAGAGRNPGDFLQFENFDGAGLQGVAIKDGGRLWFKRDNDAVTDFANVWITRDIKATTPGLGVAGVSSSLRVDLNVKKALDSYEWGIVCNLVYDTGNQPPRDGQHVAVYPRVEKRSPGNLWAICGEMRDKTPSPTGASVAQELSLGATGDDPFNQRIGLHLSMGSALDTDGTNIWSDGICISAPIARVQSKRHIRLQGAAKVGIDFTELDTIYSDKAIKLRTNHLIEWFDDFNSATSRGAIRWSSVANTIQLGGVPVAVGAASPATHRMTLNISGFNYYIDMTAAP
ncbi:hypothetical protein BTR14_18445 [Rhizobium rhizosphaerae]|uniref:Uncharacterized protein n=1 Tax=Xaviernesmea rhizosphaerae TaxID=1672749 RepID=A0ABX3PA28_9HYPH|nr:hypothetical protein [Xaviernesmea rhizosphaerae]OQP84611.1 hypothetical protein BTR14_18445 [Xaviernesmea rhizosphaerae]